MTDIGETETEDRTPLRILGRVIGTNVGWDGGDTPEGFYVYDFIPCDVLTDDLPAAATLNINFENGMFEYWDAAGEITKAVDMVHIAAMLTRSDT